MARYIDANALIGSITKRYEYDFGRASYVLEEIENAPTADVMEIITNELTNKISERIIQFLEENYEIIPKKPEVRCKDCVHRHQTTCPFLIANAYKTSSDDDFCSRGERRTNE